MGGWMDGDSGKLESRYVKLKFGKDLADLLGDSLTQLVCMDEN